MREFSHSMALTDSHAHIYLSDWEDGQDDMIRRAMDNGIGGVVMPHIDDKSTQAMITLHQRYPDWCWPTMGLHPCSVKHDFSNILERYEQHLADQSIPWVAIGETGLDYYWDLTYKEEQKAAFDQQLKWSCELDLPIIIHSRESLEDCIEMVTNRQDGRLRGVFHCFSGSREQADRICDLGMCLGVGGVVTFKNGGLDQILNRKDLSAIILETDSPFLSPVPHRGKRNEPSYLPIIAERLSVLLDLPVTELAETTTINCRNLFRIPE
jgi:TatD DNase family protein